MALWLADQFKKLADKKRSEILEAAKRYKPKKPLPNLERFGNGNFYQTPVVQDVIFGNLTRPIKGSIDIVADKCNFGYEIHADLGIIDIPPRQVVWRNPFCTPDKPPFPPPPPPWTGEEIIPNPPARCESGIWLNVNSAEQNFKEEKVYDDGINGKYSYSRVLEITMWEYPKLTNEFRIGNHDADLMVEATYHLNEFTNTRYMREFSNNDLDAAALAWTNRGGTVGNLNNDSSIWTLNGSSNYRFHWVTYVSGNPVTERLSGFIFPRYFVDPRATLTNKNTYESSVNRSTTKNTGIAPNVRLETLVNRWYFICGTPYFPPPPPNIEPKECDCMNCCDDTLLKLILKRLGDLPAKVPDNFTKQNPVMIDIESLAELLLWQTKQIDALMGAYPIEIKIEDTDLVQEGNQSQTIKIPNQAEALAELIGLAITTKRDTHATLITAIKAMAEAGMSKQLATKTLDVALANAEYLGYKLEQKKKNIPSLFTPNGKDLTETLKEKNVEIISYENTDKNDLQDDLKILKTMAARWNAQNWRQITGDPVEVLKQKLFGNPDAIKEVHIDGEQGDFNDFTEQAERGFIEVSGITDTINPWGRPYKERPKIREIGSEKGRYDKDGKEKEKEK